jgi:hypothetical protein
MLRSSALRPLLVAGARGARLLGCQTAPRILVRSFHKPAGDKAKALSLLKESAACLEDGLHDAAVMNVMLAKTEATGLKPPDPVVVAMVKQVSIHEQGCMYPSVGMAKESFHGML